MAIIEAGMRSDNEGRRVVPELLKEERAAWVTTQERKESL
jgi:predicted transcriptional regulator